MKKQYNQEEVRLAVVIPQIQHLIEELDLNEVPFLSNLLAQV